MLYLASVLARTPRPAASWGGSLWAVSVLGRWLCWDPFTHLRWVGLGVLGQGPRRIPGQAGLPVGLLAPSRTCTSLGSSPLGLPDTF